MKKRKLLEKVLSGSKNIQFNEMVTLIEAFGFSLSRINGSHHNKKGKVTPYQVR